MLQQQAKIILAPMQWASLHDIEDIKELNADDADCLSEIGEVLKKHGMTNRFGINLLHKHFDIFDDELLIESTDKQNRKLIIEAVSVEKLGESVQTNWMFIDKGQEPILWCTQRCGKDIHGNHTDGGHSRV